jgi:hypothetical protein
MRDSDVRRAVLDWLAGEHAHEMERTRIVEEMGVWSGSVRIDVAVINGSLSGYELKSDRDTLERLPFQRDLYGRVFDFVHLVVGSRHLEKATALVPEWWGVRVAVMCNGAVELRRHREPQRNPSPDPYLVAQLLWKDEALRVLEAFDLATGWRSKKIKLIHQRLATELPFDELQEHVRNALKARPLEWLKASSTAPIRCDGSPRFLPSAPDCPASRLMPLCGLL